MGPLIFELEIAVVLATIVVSHGGAMSFSDLLSIA